MTQSAAIIHQQLFMPPQPSSSSSSSPSPSSSFATTLYWPFVAVFIVAFCGSLLPVSQQTMQKFCGKSLTDAMDLVCVNGYNDKISSSGPAKKREANDFFASQVTVENAAAAVAAATAAESYLEPTFVLLNTYARSPFAAANIYANILANVRHRRNGGVYDECCRKPCSYGELAAYCRSAN